MKNILILFTLLLSGALAERATITIKSQAHGNDANLYCAVDGSDCPDGSSCEAISGNNGRCTVFTAAEDQGASEFDHVASTVLSLETQLDASAAAISCDMSGALTGNAENRCLEQTVTLSDIASADYASSCTVAYSGSIGSDITAGTQISGSFSSTAGSVSCHFVPQNNKFLGDAYASVEFTKSSNINLGESASKKVKVSLSYKPGSSGEPALSGAHALISTNVAETGIESSTSGAKGSGEEGTLILDYDFRVQDSRYLVRDQSGVETLAASAGDFTIQKNGLIIGPDYSNFNSGAGDFISAGNSASKEAYADYRSGDCTSKGPAAAGGEFAGTSCTGHYGSNYAQYRLEGVYKAVYTGMPHLKTAGGYFECDICTDGLSISGFSGEMDALLPITKANLGSGCVGSSTNKCVEFDNIFAIAVSSGNGLGADNKFLRLPSASGYLLGDFFTPVLAGKTGYEDLDDTFDILGTTRLVMSDSTRVEGASSSLVKLGGCGNGAGEVRLMQSNMQNFADQLFYTDCKIEVSDTAYGQESSIIFFKSDEAATLCTADAAQCSDAVTAGVVQVDGRRIIVDDTELSLLQRKLATVEKAGAALTMQISKYGVTGALTFTIKGTNTMMGWDDQSNACATAEQANCNGEAAVPGEVAVTTSSVDGQIVKHVIRSSPSCTGFLDVRLIDQAKQFAIYDLRLPCSRTTGRVEDHIQLKFVFDLSYSLISNLVTAQAHYVDAMASATVTDFDSGSWAGLGLSQDLVVTAQYGSCSGDNIDAKGDGCAQDFTDSPTNAKFVSSGLDIDAWRNCGSLVDDHANDAYIITTNVAMKYVRTLDYTSTTGATLSTNSFCNDKTFITTIKRDATASVTVSTLRAPTLERALVVEGIEWQSCGGDEYKLVIDLAATEQDVDTPNTTPMANAALNNVLKPVSTAAKDSDNLEINKGSMGIGSEIHTFKLESACIAISQTDCDAISNPEASPTGGASDFAKLSHTETDLVLRGDFEGGDVDSDARITTKFLECPIASETNDAVGELRAGASFACANGQQATAASSTLDGVNDCSVAFTTGDGSAQVDLYIVPDGHSGLLTTGHKTAASGAGWQIRRSIISIERYEKNFDGSEGALITTDVLCDCGTDGADYDGSVCDSGVSARTTDRVFGLVPFASLSCGTGAAPNVVYDKIAFEFQPLISASADTFKIHFDLLAENAAGARRRLRSSYIVPRKQLAASQSISADTSAFGLILPSAETTTAAPTAADDKLEWWAIMLIVIGSVSLLGLGIWGIDSATGFLSGSPSSGQFGSGRAAAVGIRQSRFSNLRY